MAETIKDPFVQTIDDLIQSIEMENKSVKIPHIPSREEILNTHYAFIRTLMIL